MKKITLNLLTLLLLQQLTVAQISIIPSPAGYENNGRGYVNNPIEFLGNTYFRYIGNDGNYDLAKYDGTSLTIFQSPTGFENGATGAGYEGNPIVIGSTLYLRYKSNTGNYNLAKFDGSTLTVLPNPSGYTYGYFGSPVEFAGSIFMKFMNTAGNYHLMSYNGSVFTPHIITNYYYEGIPFVLNSNIYLKYKNGTGAFFLGKFNGTTASIISSPANYSNNTMGYQGDPIELNGNLYTRFRDNSGQGNLFKYDGTTLSVIPITFNHSYLGSPAKVNGKIYMQYRDASSNYYLCQFNGTTTNLIASPVGYQSASHGYGALPIVIDTVLYMQYLGDDNNTDLARFDGTNLTIMPSPSGYENASFGYDGSLSTSLNGSIVARYKANDNHIDIATWDGITFTMQPTLSGYENANSGYYQAPINHNSALYMWYLNNSTICNLVKFDGNTQTVIPNPVNNYGNAYTGYYGFPIVSNGNLFMQFRGNDGNLDLAKLLNCSPTTSTITISECNSYTSPSGAIYTSSNTYTDIIPNITGCDSLITINLTISTIDPTVVVNTNIISANQTGANYRWLDCDNSNALISGETNQSFTATTSGNYAVEITLNSCVDTSICSNITVTSITNYANSTLLKIYPNPTHSLLNVQTTEAAIISISNVLGQELINKRIQTNEVIDVSNFENGIYFVKDLNSGKTIKFIKQ